MMYFTADQHFGSKRALELSRRPFKSVEEMDNIIVENFNNKVGEDDTTFHIGDFGDFSYLKELNGEHIFILGNYEKDEYMKSYAEKHDGYNEYEQKLLDYGFKQVFSFGGGLHINITDGKDNNRGHFFLIHQPDHCIKNDPNIFNLFGHIHGRQMIKRYGIDVGVDGHHFYPISVKDVLFYKTAIEQHYDENVFE